MKRCGWCHGNTGQGMWVWHGGTRMNEMSRSAMLWTYWEKKTIYVDGQVIRV